MAYMRSLVQVASAGSLCILLWVLPQAAAAQESPQMGALYGGERLGLGQGISTSAATQPAPGTTRREITLAGTQLVIPVVVSAAASEFGRLNTTLEVANLTGSAATVSVQFRDGAGLPAALLVQDPSCGRCSLATVTRSLGPFEGGRIPILASGPFTTAWAAITLQPEASVSVSATIEARDDDETLSSAGVPPTSSYSEAWVYGDNTGKWTTVLSIVNPSGTQSRTYQVRFRDFSDPNISCQVAVQVASSGQAIVWTNEALPCSSGELGLLEIGGGMFTGAALVLHEDGSLLTRQFVSIPIGVV